MTPDAVPVPSIATGLDYPEVRELVQKLCAGFTGAYWRALEDNVGYPTEFVNAMTDAGLLAALIPAEYGGAGLSLRAAAVILEEVNASGCNASQCHAQMYIMGTLVRHGSPAQKQAVLPLLASGALRLQAFAVTEPTTGSDTTQVRTRAVRDGGGFVISGQKVWTSRALHSDLMLVLARTTPAAQCNSRTDGLSVFLVDIREHLDRGLRIRPLPAMINHNSTEVFFDAVRVPESALVGELNRGFRHLLDGLNAERILIAAEAIGDGRWFLRRACEYARDRVVFGRPIGQNQGVQFPLARVHAELEAADLMVRRAAALFDANSDSGPDANMAKLLASEAAWHAAEAALQTFGGFGFAREYDVERKWRETRLFQTAPVSTNLILAYIGQHVLGLPRSF